MAYNYRRRAIAIAKEAYLLWSRRGIKVPGFHMIEVEQGQDHIIVVTAIDQPTQETIQGWVVELTLEGKVRAAFKATEYWRKA